MAGREQHSETRWTECTFRAGETVRRADAAVSNRKGISRHGVTPPSDESARGREDSHPLNYSARVWTALCAGIYECVLAKHATPTPDRHILARPQVPIPMSQPPL